MKQILINSEELQTRVAVVCDNFLHDFFIERNTRDHLVGSIFKGRIKNLEPSLQAAFVDIGCGKNAFLHYEDMIPAVQDLDDEDDDNNEDECEVATTPQLQVPNGNTQHQLPPIAQNKGFFSRFRAISAKLHQVQTPKPTLDPETKQKILAAQRHRKGSAPHFTPEEIQNLFKPDQEILVQVVKGPIMTKGARVTANISIPGRYLVLLPGVSHIGISRKVEEKSERDRLRQMAKTLQLPPNTGVICRTVGEGCKAEHFQRDLDILLNSWKTAEENAANHKAPYCVYQEPDLAERTIRDCMTSDVDEIVTDSKATYDLAVKLLEQYKLQDAIKVKLYQNPTPIFQKYGLTQQLESIFNRKVSLPSGGYICIDETEALIAIDVNTGKNRSGKDQPETILATNLEAVAEIARQLRLRNVGGLVVLDLIDMASKKDQQLVYKTLREHLAADHARIRTTPISQLGLLEMTRQRENESVESTIYDNCPYCKGRGLVKNATSMSADIQRKLNEIFAKRKHNQMIKPGYEAKITAHPRVLERFHNEDAKVLQAIEQEYNIKLTLLPDPSLHIEDFHILDGNSGQRIS